MQQLEHKCLTNNDVNACTQLDKTLILKINRKACSLGSREACLRIARNHLYNNNIAASVSLYRDLCNTNELQACYELGILYLMKNNKQEAHSLLEKSCLESINSDTNLKYCKLFLNFELQNGFTKNVIKIFKAQCKKANLCSGMGNLYLTLGKPSKAEQYFKQTCQNSKHKIDCYELGLWELAKMNLPKAKKFLTHACKQKLKQACNFLNLITDNLDTNLEKYHKVFNTACKQKIYEGCWYSAYLGSCPSKQGISCLFKRSTKPKLNLKKETIYLKSFNHSKYPYGDYKTAIISLNRKNKFKSFKLLTQSCQNGVISACYLKNKLSIKLIK